MTRLEVWLGGWLVGWLAVDAESRFTFTYGPGWLAYEERFPLSPRLPLTDAPPASIENHSAVVRQFFDNLLPEGRALDEAAQAEGVSKTNLVALLIALGRESAGAFRIRLERDPAVSKVDDHDDGHDHRHAHDGDRASVREHGGGGDHENDQLLVRELTFAELSNRIRARPYEPFSVWDGRVRLSIAGLQDKLAVAERGGRWYLPDGGASSTHILKPDQAGRAEVGLTSNEFFCMRLAQRAGLSVAPVRLAHVPEPVLVVERFDRRRYDNGRVSRIHIIDGCQALGLPTSHKYEQSFGSGRDVAHIRDGASLPRLFNLLRPGQVAAPVVERQKLLRWVLFQVIIGNIDAHAKNLSFFVTAGGLSIAPAYDLVNMPALADERIETGYAMAIGDAFRYEDLDAEEWTDMALSCGLGARLVANELVALTTRVQAALPATVAEVQQEGSLQHVVERARAVTALQCEQLAAMAAGIRRPNPRRH